MRHCSAGFPLHMRGRHGVRGPLAAAAALLLLAVALPGRGGEEAGPKQALDAAEALMHVWDFQGAAQALAKLKTDDAALAARIAARCDEADRLAKLKARMIARINEAQPRLRKGSVLIRGINGDLTKADAQAITATLPNGQAETHAWQSLSDRSVERLVALTVDRDSADDWLAAGLLALVANDPAGAEESFGKARALGAQTDRYLDTLAAAAFDRARDLIANKKLAEAQAELAAIEKRYAKTAWLAAHKQDLDAARARAEAAADQAEAKKDAEQAEKLYAEAARLFKRKELFDLKPIIEKLKADFVDAPAVTDANRSPSFAEMLKAVENVGKFLTVRRTGKADFQRIQDAINDAPPYSVIEVQDDGPFNEKLAIPKEKVGLTLRGWKHGWPVVTSAGKTGAFGILLDVQAADTTIERLVLAHPASTSGWGAALKVSAGPSRMRSLVIYMKEFTPWFTLLLGRGQGYEMEGCAVAGNAPVDGDLAMKDCVWLKCYHSDGLHAKHGLKAENCVLIFPQMSGAAELRNCTVTHAANFRGASGSATDCILNRVEAANAGVQIDCCDVYPGGFLVAAKAGKKCFAADPRFADPKNLDYRLPPNSPCRKKGVEGGDLGCHYTPEVIELVRKCLDLRKRGIITF